MTWGNISNIITTNLDAASDSPASARVDLKNALDEITSIINGLGTTGGPVKLELDGKIFANNGIKTTTDKNLNLLPYTSMVKITSFINLAPVAFASLPSAPVMGDIAFLTTDGAAATKNKLVYYETANNRWNYVVDDAAVATS
tara:strand:- start:42 stop:470 length:429 start_codon:yes stop_codon:yes gene_type:complete